MLIGLVLLIRVRQALNINKTSVIFECAYSLSTLTFGGCLPGEEVEQQPLLAGSGAAKMGDELKSKQYKPKCTEQHGHSKAMPEKYAHRQQPIQISHLQTIDNGEMQSWVFYFNLR